MMLKRIIMHLFKRKLGMLSKLRLMKVYLKLVMKTLLIKINELNKILRRMLKMLMKTLRKWLSFWLQT